MTPVPYWFSLSAVPMQLALPAQVAAPLPSAGTATGWWITGAVVVALPILFFVLSKTSRMGIIAAATFKETIRQPLFFVLLGLAVLVQLVNTFLPFYSFGEDVKMLKDTGLSTLLICGLLLAVWTASTGIAEEIEGKTAMTLLSKPITRRQFVLGKYLGIMEAVYVLLAVGGAIFLGFIYFKVGYDAKESGQPVPPWYVLTQFNGLSWRVPLPEMSRLGEALQVVPGLLLSFLEVAVLGAVSVAISTRLPMVVNMTVCFTIFIVGHLTPVLVQSEGGGRAVDVVRFIAQLIAIVLPALEAFKMDTAVATDRFVPPEYLGYAALYGLCYVSAMLLLAFILFEDRDLA